MVNESWDELIIIITTFVKHLGYELGNLWILREFW